MENNQNTSQNSDMPLESNSKQNEETLSTSKEEELKEKSSDISPESFEEKTNSEDNCKKSSCDEENSNTENNIIESNNDNQKLLEENNNKESNITNEKQLDDADKTKLDETTKEHCNTDNNAEDSSKKEKNANNSSKKYFFKIIDYILEKNIFSKLFVIIFATIVFSYAYCHQESITRSALSYIGLILCVIVCYIEILGIRDHIWIIEGSIPATKQWREAFLTPSTLRRHKIRKMIILLFAFLVFVGIYRLKCFVNYREAISFLGII
ncbi:MAG: hypothetical protein J6Z11_12580, partial [Candidatus Riflebacteria bacterium]|nr:hypothetical protein [Candidatus Riflebacteria bacterium]